MLNKDCSYKAKSVADPLPLIHHHEEDFFSVMSDTKYYRLYLKVIFSDNPDAYPNFNPCRKFKILNASLFSKYFDQPGVIENGLRTFAAPGFSFTAPVVE